ncbi:histone deacetylase family protein [Phaeocystidibacter luteus]|uniref:Histone deacetylase n=1 Tax=Phaeocystidibacter luteus TaxID=911197 RepID=A0A6N6RDI6_9FLAO|nr:histone deacetylase [Phaeocystidibacter luteus]KAB2806823.1 histone deacetylase [Phaeocystidibacter luteus]
MFRIAFDPIYCHPLPDGHRFPMAKYELLPEQLIREGTVEESAFFAPDLLTEDRILRTHESEYWEKLKNGTLERREERKIGFPWSEALVRRERTICRGTAMNTEYAMQDGVSFNIAGGTHHAYTNRGEGFCLLNDIAIGAHHLIDHHNFERILVVDLDVHQGNGTAQIFENEPRVFTFSIHGEKNYPLQKENSDLDIGVPDGIGDRDYLKLVDKHVKSLVDEFQPQFIFFQSGVDILENDKLGRLGVSLAGCRERDRIVFETAHRDNIPVAVNMGGGYSEKLADIIEAHANTYRMAASIFG